MSMKKRYVLFIFLFILPGSLYSQDTTFIDKIKVPSIIDTLFIDHDLNNWSVRFYTNYKNNRFKLRNENEKVQYAPNNPFGIGVGLGTRKLVLDIGFNLKSKDKEPTERYDLQATLMVNNHLLDYSLQSYHGFNLRNENGERFRPDISSFSSRLNYLYNFNAAEYSMAAMKSGLSKQKKPAITAGLGGFLFINRVSADSSIIPRELFDYFNKEARILGISGMAAGILANFSASVPFFKNFFVSLSITPGIGLMYKFVEAESLSYEPRNPVLYQMDLAGILGYNARKYYINFSVGYALFETSLDFDNRTTFNTTRAKFAIGYKIGKN